MWGKVRFHVLTATSVNMAVFWDVTACSLIHIDRRFRRAYYLIAQMMEAVSTSETSVSTYLTTQRNIP
jgi:hypothetical protein